MTVVCGVVFLEGEEFYAVAGGEDEAFTDAGLVEEGAGGVGEAFRGYGEALADLDGRGVVVDAEENEAAWLVGSWARSWGGKPVDCGELVRGPDGEDDQEDEAGEVDGAASRAGRSGGG